MSNFQAEVDHFLCHDELAGQIRPLSAALRDKAPNNTNGTIGVDMVRMIQTFAKGMYVNVKKVAPSAGIKLSPQIESTVNRTTFCSFRQLRKFYLCILVTQPTPRVTNAVKKRAKYGKKRDFQIQHGCRDCTLYLGTQGLTYCCMKLDELEFTASFDALVGQLIYDQFGPFLARLLWIFSIFLTTVVVRSPKLQSLICMWEIGPCWNSLTTDGSCF